MTAESPRSIRLPTFPGDRSMKTTGSSRTVVWPGRPYPLGATWDGLGVNFALFSANATKVELCLFDETGTREIDADRRCPNTPTRSGTATCRKRGPARSTATASTAPTSRRPATASTRTSCCSTPTPRRWSERCAGSRRAVRLPRRQTARRPVLRRARQRARHAEMPRGRPRLHLGRRPRAAVPWERHDHLRSPCARLHHAQPGCARALRGTFAASATPGGDRLPALGSASPRSSSCRSTPSSTTAIWSSGAQQLLGLQHDRLLRARAALSDRPASLSPSSRTMVARLHDAGIEVILDVVYNHTAEGNELGPTLSLQRHRQRQLLPADAGRHALLHQRHRHRQHANHRIRACSRW